MRGDRISLAAVTRFIVKCRAGKAFSADDARRARILDQAEVENPADDEQRSDLVAYIESL